MKSDLILPPSPQQQDKECDLRRCELCTKTKLLSWLFGTARMLCLFSCWTQAVGDYRNGKFYCWHVLIRKLHFSERVFLIKTKHSSVKQKESELLTPPSESPLPQGRLQQTDQYSSVFQGLPTQATCHKQWETGATAVCGATMTS